MTSPKKKTKAEMADPAAATHRTPEYQQERADELIQQAGAEAGLVAAMHAAVDWSQAPKDATSYVIRDDNRGNTKAFWSDGIQQMDAAPKFFDIGEGQSLTIARKDCRREPLTGIVDVIDELVGHVKYGTLKLELANIRRALVEMEELLKR